VPPYSESDKLQWEIEKLKVETTNLRRPFLRQPTLWLALAPLVLSLAGNAVQYSKAERDRQLAEIKREKLDLETEKLQKKEIQLQDSLAKTKRMLEEGSSQLQNVQQRLVELQGEIATASSSKEALLRTVGELRKSTSAVQQISDNTAESLSDAAARTSPTTAAKWRTAQEMERQGFIALIESRFDDAAKAFQASEDAANGYHYAYELARLIRKRRTDLQDPPKRKEVFKIIATSYSGGAPKELIDRLRDLSK